MSADLPRAQRAALEAIADEQSDRSARSGTRWQRRDTGTRVWVERHRGQRVIDELRRYLERSDADQIGHALYEHLTLHCGFIAHHGLVPPDGGFRIEYREPVTLIDEWIIHQRLRLQIAPEVGEWEPTFRHPPERVYADGLTDHDVARAVCQLISEHRQAAVAHAEQARHDREVSALVALAEQREFILVPAGYELVDATAPPSADERSLLGALQQLAARHGKRLVAPGDQLQIA